MEPDDLYGLPLERFVAERGALAKTMRSGGQRGQAARVAKLARPSVAAWAINQLVRTQQRAIASLFEAGDELARAQADVVSGRGDAQTLREAAARERAAVSALTDAARGLLSTEGHELSHATLERVTDTLHAAALDPQARAQVAEGCLTRELRHVGLGAGAVGQAPPGQAGRAPGRPDAGQSRRARAPASSADSAADERQREAERAARQRAARERAQRREAARKDEADARRASERAARELELAQERRDRAAEALREAEEALSAAREHARAAAAAHRRAREDADGA